MYLNFARPMAIAIKRPTHNLRCFYIVFVCVSVCLSLCLVMCVSKPKGINNHWQDMG